MPSSVKQLAFSVKKLASRELPRKGANIVNMSQGTSPLPKDKGPGTDPGKAVSTKRPQTDAPSSPVYHNVYVRRKVESDHSKVNSSQELKGNNGRDKTKEQEAQKNVQHDQANKTELSSPIAESASIVSSDKIKEQEAQQNMQHDQANKPELSSPAESAGIVSSDKIKEQEAQQNGHHDQANKPELSTAIAESAGIVSSDKIKEQEAQQNGQHDQANKPELSSAIAESAGIVSSDKIKEQEGQKNVQHVQANKPELSSPIADSAGIVSSKSPEKSTAEVGPEKTEPPIASGTTVQDDTPKSSDQYWNERFNRLQTYLENCDRSTQEGYMRMLRSLSATGRSMHAIELEKRAIHLLVEEGKELQRMKALNVLGKVSPNGSSKQTPSQQQYQK